MTDSTIQTRAARIIEAYDRQGIHRTGTPVDEASAAWLEKTIAANGGTAERHGFTLERLDIQAARLEITGETLDGLPLFDGGLTGPGGVTGRLCAPGGDGDIVFIACGPRGNEALLAARKDGPYKAVVVATDCGRPGLSPINADAFTAPFGPPVLQVSSEHTGPLEDAARSNREVTLIADAVRTTAEAFNVAARIAGQDPALPPLVVMTPRSGWWSCASERGGGLVLFLEILRALAAAQPDRDVIFTANSGHELGHLGLDAFLEENPGLVHGAHCWIHLGANFAAAIAPGPHLQCSDDALRTLALDRLRAHDAPPAAEVLPGTRPRGEARNVYDRGGRYISLLGDNGLFHHPVDHFPDAVDLDVTERLARAFVEIATALARAESP
jgi:hypothetical protein